MKSSPSRRPRRGFTLVEVLLVLVILVIIVSLAATNYISAQKRAYKKAAEAEIGLLSQPLDMYYLDLNCYPTSDQGLEALRTPPADAANSQKWQGPYLKNNVPLDPWENPYRYVAPGQRNPDSYDLWSMGPDGADGTDDDIGNW
jgi:general secretion pathway protein G